MIVAAAMAGTLETARASLGDAAVLTGERTGEVEWVRVGEVVVGVGPHGLLTRDGGPGWADLWSADDLEIGRALEPVLGARLLLPGEIPEVAAPFRDEAGWTAWYAAPPMFVPTRLRVEGETLSWTSLERLRQPDDVLRRAALLRSGDTMARRSAAAVLLQSDDPRAAAALIAALGDEDPGVRELAADGLDGVLAAAAGLAELLRADPVPEVRRAAARSLRHNPDPAAQAALAAAAADPDPVVRALAARGGP